jgi:3-oxoacyl-[acyl-carrier-protein] synthase II
MSCRVAVTGLGAVSGFGHGVDRLFAALLLGDRAMKRSAFPRGIDPGPLAIVDDGPFDTTGRATRLALDAAREAVADAGLAMAGARLGVAVGTTLGAIDVWLSAVRGDGTAPASELGYAAPAHAVAASVGATGPVEVVSVACASANVALGTAVDLLRAGRCQAVLAGGVDALNDFVISGFASLKALSPTPCQPFDRARSGLNLGEGAAFLVLETEPHARARSAHIRAFLDGYGVAADAVHMTGPDREGRGAARAMSAALKDAGVRPEAVDLVSAHGTATVFNDLMESHALRLTLGATAGSVPVHSIKASLGHTLGAAGALEAVACVRALETGRFPPTAGLDTLDPDIHLQVVRDRPLDHRGTCALSTSSGFGGTNAAVVIRAAGTTR